MLASKSDPWPLIVSIKSYWFRSTLVVVIVIFTECRLTQPISESFNLYQYLLIVFLKNCDWLIWSESTYWNKDGFQRVTGFSCPVLYSLSVDLHCIFGQYRMTMISPPSILSCHMYTCSCSFIWFYDFCFILSSCLPFHNPSFSPRSLISPITCITCHGISPTMSPHPRVLPLNHLVNRKTPVDL